jgi:RND family efflux transporter MFP subunit
VLILFLAGLGARHYANSRPLAVRTLVVREIAGDDRSVLNASGYVTARREATVSSKITGKVMEVLIEEGMRVASGQVLARLDDSNVQASLALAQAQVEAASAGLEETRARVDQAERELRRVDSLTEVGVATRADLDNANAEVKSLRARLGRQAKEAEVARREAEVWLQQREDTVIRAPFAGVVTAKNAQPGEMISPMSAGGGFTRTGIGTLVDMDSLEIEVDVNESFINRVQTGQVVEATLDAYAEVHFPCKVIAIIPSADRQKATVKVRVGFDKLDPRILPDMGVKVSFRAPADTSAKRGFNIPAKAVRQQEGRAFVLVLVNGRAEARTITADAQRGEDAFVVEGLTAGDKVIVDGPEALAAGALVVEGHR